MSAPSLVALELSRARLPSGRLPSGRLLVAAHRSTTAVQWSTLGWIIGAAVTAAVIIAIIVLVSRRPKSMEHGIEEFSRSLQAVAPNHRSTTRPGPPGHVRASPAGTPPQGAARVSRGETETV